MTRTWLVDPQEVEAKASGTRKQKGEIWNGRDFLVTLGDPQHRTWEDCMEYGYISAGGHKKFSQPLEHLHVGARVFVHIPKSAAVVTGSRAGYVGVGTVKEKLVPVTEFTVSHDGKEVPVLEAPLRAPHLAEHAQDPEKYEYFVRVEWIKTLPQDKAYWEKGLYSNQNTASKLRSQFTLERLAQQFNLKD